MLYTFVYSIVMIYKMVRVTKQTHSLLMALGRQTRYSAGEIIEIAVKGTTVHGSEFSINASSDDGTAVKVDVK